MTRTLDSFPAHSLTRRSFVALSAVALASLGLPMRAFADNPTPQSKIVIVHTNDVHCSVDAADDGHLGYAKLANYVSVMKQDYGADNVVLVDAGDAVQGNSMGTLTSGESLAKIMNACAYDFAVPGNHEFDYGMEQFNNLVLLAGAKYLSCNFTRLDTNTLMFDAFAIKEYPIGAGTKKVGFIGICTPESLTKSSPSHFWNADSKTNYGFCEDESGTKLYEAVQSAVDQARNAGADYVVAIAHLGQTGITPRWTSSAVVANTSGIDVLIDGHSHEQYVQTVANKAGKDVLVTQTGTQLMAIGQVIIDPSAQSITAATPTCTDTLVTTWDGSDTSVAALVTTLEDELKDITSRVIGYSKVDLRAFEDDGYTWAVRSHETNLGDFVTDAYLALAWNGGVAADVALVNGGGLRADIKPGDVTYGNILDVQPYSNQICYVETKGQNILDALEMGARFLPEPDGSFQHVSGLTYTVRTDIPTSVQIVNQQFAGVTGEYRVRDVMVGDQPLDVNKTYKLVSHSYLLVEGGSGMTMFMNDEAVLLDLDSAALIEYLQLPVPAGLGGTIGDEYADTRGQGRISIKNGPDPDPAPSPDEPDPTPQTTPVPTNDTDQQASTLVATGDNNAAAVAAAATAAAAAVTAMAACGARIHAQHE